MGSLAELETQLIIANKLEYIDDNRLETFNKDIELLRKKMLNFIKYQRRKIDAQ
ncbi:four helix bundle protein [Desulfohalobiaceae bacterium Ax17]|nr:four helix bundle protein [Desulfovulcanus ferrireducens]